MPSAPKLRDAAGVKRLGKIFTKAHAEHPGAADGDVRRPAEIRVELEGKAYGAEHKKASRVCRVVPVYRIHHHAQPLRDDQLLKQSPEHPPQAEKHIRSVKPRSKAQRRSLSCFSSLAEKAF